MGITVGIVLASMAYLGNFLCVPVENNSCISFLGVTETMTQTSSKYGLALSSDNGSSFASVNPITNRIYVANWRHNTVSVIDGNTNTKIASIPVDMIPHKLAINPNTNRIYVTEDDSLHKIDENGTVLVIDGNTNTKIASISIVGVSQIIVNPITNRVYVIEHNQVNNIEPSDTVSVIDANTNTKIASIPVGANSLGMDVNPNTNRIYVLHSNFFHNIDHTWKNGTVSVIDGNTNIKIASIQVGAQPLGIAVNANTNRIYVTNYIDGTISVIDGINNKIIKTIKLEPGVEGIAINLLTNKIYVANGLKTTLSVLDGDTGSKKSEIRVAGWSVAVNPSTNRIFVPDYYFNNLSVIDGKYDNIMAVIQIGVYPN